MDYQITSPNTCSLVNLGTQIVYTEGTGVFVSAPDTYTFTEYLTPEDAAAAALLINPNYNVNQILGSLTLDPVNVSDPDQTAYIGTDLTLNSEYSCSDPTATVTYSWTGPNGDLGITTSSLSFDNLTDAYAGTYTCTATASNSLSQTGSVENSFQLSVVPAPEPSGVINTGRSGASALDLAPSYFPTLNNMPSGVDESGLELYVPGTDTVIPYNASLPAPFRFDSSGNCFASGDFRLVIRVAATSEVLATVYPPGGANRNILWLYNSTVPSAPASGGEEVAVPF